MIQKKWLSIEIGYESPVAETCDQQPPMQKVFESLFSMADRQRWSRPGVTEISSNPVGDEWVADVLMKEINDALAKTGSTDPVKGVSLRCLFPEVGGYRAISATAVPTGEPGTRCKLVEDKWVNSRSYHLERDGGVNWPVNADPQTAFVFATVNWRCWPNEN